MMERRAVRLEEIALESSATSPSTCSRRRRSRAERPSRDISDSNCKGRSTREHGRFLASHARSIQCFKCFRTEVFFMHSSMYCCSRSAVDRCDGLRCSSVAYGSASVECAAEAISSASLASPISLPPPFGFGDASTGFLRLALVGEAEGVPCASRACTRTCSASSGPSAAARRAAMLASALSRCCSACRSAAISLAISSASTRARARRTSGELSLAAASRGWALFSGSSGVTGCLNQGTSPPVPRRSARPWGAGASGAPACAEPLPRLSTEPVRQRRVVRTRAPASPEAGRHCSCATPRRSAPRRSVLWCQPTADRRGPATPAHRCTSGPPHPPLAAVPPTPQAPTLRSCASSGRRAAGQPRAAASRGQSRATSGSGPRGWFVCPSFEWGCLWKWPKRRIRSDRRTDDHGQLVAAPRREAAAASRTAEPCRRWRCHCRCRDPSASRLGCCTGCSAPARRSRPLPSLPRPLPRQHRPERPLPLSHPGHDQSAPRGAPEAGPSPPESAASHAHLSRRPVPPLAHAASVPPRLLLQSPTGERTLASAG